MNRIKLLGLLFLLVAAPAQAQTGLQRAKAALPRDAARELEQTVAAARKRGLPSEPLVDKALEGAAKRVPPANIISAVRQKLDLLSRADAALRPFGPPSAADVTATADVLQRGVSVDVIKKARAGQRKGEPIGLALHTVADLVDRGVPANVALEVLSSWRERGGQSEQLRRFPAEVERLIRSGASPSEAGRSVADAERRGRAVGPPGRDGGRERARGRGNERRPETPAAGKGKGRKN